MNVKLSMVAYACSTSAGETEAGALLQVQSQPGQSECYTGSPWLFHYGAITTHNQPSGVLHPLESAKAACVLHSYDHPIDMSISGNHAKSENNDKHHVFCVFT